LEHPLQPTLTYTTGSSRRREGGRQDEEQASTGPTQPQSERLLRTNPGASRTTDMLVAELLRCYRSFSST